MEVYKRHRTQKECTCSNKILASVNLTIILIHAIISGFIVLSREETPKRDDINILQQTTGSQKIHTFQAVIDRNVERRKHLEEQCRTTSRKRMHKQVRFLTDPRLSLAYCRVNKAASWYTVQTLSKMFNCTPEYLRRSSHRIRTLPYERKKHEIAGAYKFMFVREPYGRLFSTYCNKFYFPKGFWDPIGIEIIRKFRENPSAESLKYGHDVTFAELIRYVIEDFETGNKMDGHIRPMHTDCKPCEYQYDFIGKLETMTQDWKYLAHVWKSRNIITTIPEDIGEKTKNPFGEMYYFLHTLNTVKGSKVNIYDFYQRAWNYYQITSHISKNIDFPFSRSDQTPIEYSSFLQMLKTARDVSEFNATQLQAQKHEALIQAYSAVPMEDLERLKSVVKDDCLLFGYDKSPGWLFDRKALHNVSYTFNYLSGISGNKIKN